MQKPILLNFVNLSILSKIMALKFLSRIYFPFNSEKQKHKIPDSNK